MNVLVIIIIGLISAGATLFSMEAFRLYPQDPRREVLKRGFSLLGIGGIAGFVAIALFAGYVA